MQSTVVYWLGKEFGVHQYNEAWRPVPGIYIFTGLKRNSQGVLRWRPYYVGQTRNLAERIQDHHKWDQAKRQGATHVHARVEPNSYLRLLVEQELIRDYKPPLND